MSAPVNDFPRKLFADRLGRTRRVPSKRDAARFLDDTMALLFPISPEGSLEEVEAAWLALQESFRRLVSPVVPEGADAAELAERLFAELPAIWEGLLDDSRHFAECDPASDCPEEVIASYPGFYAIAVHRMAHAIHRMGVPILPRMLSELAHSRTGIDIHPGAEIGARFFIDHGTGVVIGQTTVIGRGVTVYQGVTLGATFVRKSLRGTRRHPTIEDGVILYAGCTILGGDTVVGAGSIIGGNVWLTRSVAPGSKVFYKPEVV
jgi:serine O-acetyltransferase